jgi:hypothetical protein
MHALLGNKPQRPRSCLIHVLAKAFLNRARNSRQSHIGKNLSHSGIKLAVAALIICSHIDVG